MMLAAITITSSPEPSKASRRAADRDRKRRDREAMRPAGIPDARMLDASLVDAMRDAIRARGVPDRSTMIPLREVLQLAVQSLQRRTQQGIALDQGAMHRALANRLAPRQD